MNLQEFFSTINWRTTGFALAYLLCNAASSLYPAWAEACAVIDKFIVAGGFISAADSGRIQSIVRAVDLVSWKNKIDPATLAPIEHPAVVAAPAEVK